MSAQDIAMFQIHEKLLCMPFRDFHEAMEQALNRPIQTLEIAMNYEGIAKEIRNGRPVPTAEELLKILPAGVLNDLS